MKNTSVPFHIIPERYRFVNGSVLKIIAVITMLIDHIGVGIIQPLYVDMRYPFGLTQQEAFILYRVTRNIGRIAFPIYCFLLVEALIYTTNRLRYLLVLLLSALLSELPFDLALISISPSTPHLSPREALLYNRSAVISSQNVFLTLALGFLCIWGIHALHDRVQRHLEQQTARRGIRTDNAFALPFYMIIALGSFLMIYLACVLTNMLGTDYRQRGILLIVILYLLRRLRPLALPAAYFYIGNLAYTDPARGFDLSVWSSEIWSFPGFLLMFFYNDKRGFIRGRWKYLFYAFYPVHLILIWLARMYIYI